MNGKPAAAREFGESKSLNHVEAFVEFDKADIEQSVADRYEQIARKYSNRLAVKTGTEQLTYAELDKTANRIARAILAVRGAAPEPVAILLENDAAMIASMLGVLKSGKFYVPLDPSYPLSRVQFLLADSMSALIVTNQRNLSLADHLANRKLALINVDLVDTDTESPSMQVAPDALAYILYTSGSTGLPKGVMQNHRNLLHVIMWYTNRARITANDRIALLRSFSVNGGTLHTFAALLNGASIYPFKLKEEGISRLNKWFLEEDITICGGLGATAFSQFGANLTGDEKFPNLRWILFGGEPIYKKHVDLCRRHFASDCIIVNALGATEASNFSEFVIDKDTAIEEDMLPCGYPTTDVEILLIDDKGLAVATGEVGEIAVKSRYMALGYWQKPGLTQEKFIDSGDERLYLTGDLGKKRPDGCLTYIGRKDFQVKIRGNRVEIGEVEAALLDLENICNAAVTLWEDPLAGDKKLVAYIVPEKQPAPTVSVLRRVLRDRLPTAIVPSLFVILHAMPLTPHGKLDRSALPAPQRVRPALDAMFVPPQTLIEQDLAQIWTEILAIDRIGIHDDFFDLGGDSLAAMRVVSQVVQKFQLEIPLRSLFQSPTVAEMARVITESHGKRLGEQDLNRILTELESLSDDEARRLLADQEETAIRK